MTVASCKKISKFAVGFAKEKVQRTKATKLALAPAMASALADFTYIRKQYPEFIKMCKAVGIEPDSEIEMMIATRWKLQVRRKRKHLLQ